MPINGWWNPGRGDIAAISQVREQVPVHERKEPGHPPPSRRQSEERAAEQYTQ